MPPINRKSTDFGCQVTSFEALMVALRHPAVSSDPAVVCNLLQTCKGWRSALKASAAGNMVINTAKMGSLQWIWKFSKFSAWVPEYAGLLSGILLADDVVPAQGMSLQDFDAQVADMLTPAIAAATAANQLHLNEFSIRMFRGAAGLLQLLPAASLTKLSLADSHLTSGLSINSKTATQAIRALTALRDLSIMMDLRTALPSNSILQVISGLQSLTSLTLRSAAAGSDMALLPAWLQQLDLQTHDRAVALGHITALRQLRLCLQDKPAAGSCLPQHLTSLHLAGCCTDYPQRTDVTPLGVPGLTELRQLTLVDCFHQPTQLQQLSSLTQLTDLQLVHHHFGQVPSAASAWRHLTALHTLKIYTSAEERGLPLTAEDTHQFCQHLGAATSLTSLTLEGDRDFFVMFGGVDICRHFTGLQHLRELVLRDICRARDHLGAYLGMYLGAYHSHYDVMHLTALTGLTKLVLCGGDGLGEKEAVAIACWLRQLQHFELVDCGIDYSSGALLAAVGSLTHLTELVLRKLPVCDTLEEHDLMGLTTLTRLQKLDVQNMRYRDVFGVEAMRRFWAAHRRAAEQQR